MQILSKAIGWAFRPGEPSDETFRKTLLIPILLIVAFVDAVYAVVALQPIASAHGGITAVLATAVLIYIGVTKSCDQKLTEVIILAIGINHVFIQDFRTYGMIEGWSISVCIMDLLLLCSCGQTAVSIMRNLTVVYVVFLSLEQAYRFGTYDVFPEMSTLDKPRDECRLGRTGLVVLYIRLFVFISDFMMTRYFATSMREEKARIQLAVQLAQKVAEALVRFDLDQAEAVLENDGDAGEGLLDALHHLLNNLRSYRPYLPEALFMLSEQQMPSPMHYRLPPQGMAAIAFTDIQSSTMLWEVNPAVMRKAMMTHNDIMRSCLVRFNGYEVKTIGDAFMVAFDTLEEAVDFALAAQEELYQSREWADELLRQPLCQPVKGMWNGLRVRMGVHWGEVDMQLNPVTGRADYFGPTVNIASRLEGIAMGGTVAVLESAFPRGLAGLGSSASSTLIPDVLLKGIAEEVMVMLLAPSHLSDRLCRRESSPALSCLSLSASVTSSKSVSQQGEWYLRPLRGTVSHMTIDYNFLDGRDSYVVLVNNILSAAVEAVERSNGMVVSVTSSAVIAGWNIGRQPVFSHATQAAHACTLLHRSAVKADLTPYITIGVATGYVLNGKVGTDSQRFVMAIGQCLELAGDLAAAAFNLGVFTLASATPAFKCVADDPSYRSAARKVDEWVVCNGVCEVYQLSVRGKEETAGKWGWSPEYAAAYASRDIALLKQRAEADDDPVLLEVARLLIQGSTIPTTLFKTGKLRSMVNFC